MNKLNVLSLFDGMSCAQIALERAGINVYKYYASEIDKYAMMVTQANYPNTIQLGDIRQWKQWNLPAIDLIVAGSPCQGFSVAGKQLAFEDERSRLFYTFLDIFDNIAPENFLLENVRMKKEHQDTISNLLGVEPICINSALVSAQNRVRNYWTNIPNICQPEDRGILLEDVLEGAENIVYQRGRGNNPGGLKKDKSPCMGSSSWESNVKVPVIKNRGQLIHKPYKSMCLDASYFKGADNHGQRTGCVDFGDIDPSHWRKLTPVECERLQTVPDNYTNHVSDTQRYKMLGNGMTVDVIAHILKNIR